MHGVVGKENIFLHRLHRNPGVVLNPRQGNIHSLSTEVEQRLGGAMKGFPGTVNNGVIYCIQGGTRNGGSSVARAPRFTDIADITDIFRGDTLLRRTHRDGARIMGTQPLELLLQIACQQMGLGQGCGIPASFIDIAKGLLSVNRLPLMNINNKLRIYHIAVALIIAAVKDLAGKLT